MVLPASGGPTTKAEAEHTKKVLYALGSNFLPAKSPIMIMLVAWPHPSEKPKATA